jgi:hypothetical protein
MQEGRARRESLVMPAMMLLPGALCNAPVV